MKRPFQGLEGQGRRLRFRAFTLIELLAVIAIIAILAALLFPMIGRALDRGNRTKCMSNMRQWGQSLTAYLTDHNGVFPEEGIGSTGLNTGKTNAWFNALAEYIGSDPLITLCAQNRAPRPPDDKSIFTCPSFRMEDLDAAALSLPVDQQVYTPIFSYGYNLWIDHTNRTGSGQNPSGKTGFGTILRLSQIIKPASFAVFGEVASAEFDNMAGMHLLFRHDQGNSVNIVLADGHVQNFNRTNVYVAGGYATPDSPEKSINRGVIWNPEGSPPQSEFVR